EERAAEIALEAFDLGQAGEQRAMLVHAQRLVIAAGLDRGMEPRALLVVGYVLDLVSARAAVDLAQAREDVGGSFTGNMDAEERGRDPLLELGRQLGLEPLGLERGVADGLGAERVEARREMAVRA